MPTRLTAFIALTGALALPATLAPSAGAAPQVVSVRGVIARVVADECVRPATIAWHACRGHQAYGGTLLSTQPTTRELRTAQDPATGRIRFRGGEGFTGCIADRCGTLRLSLVGWFRLDASGRPSGSGRARVTRAAGELAGTTGGFEFTFGYPASYQGELTVPDAAR